MSQSALDVMLSFRSHSLSAPGHKAIGSYQDCRGGAAAVGAAKVPIDIDKFAANLPNVERNVKPTGDLTGS